MVGFGQRRIFGTVGKEHPSPPLPSPAVGEVLKPVELQLEVMDYNRICHQYFFIFFIIFHSILWCFSWNIVMIEVVGKVMGVIEYLGVHIEAGEVTKEIKKLNQEQDKGPEMVAIITELNEI